MISYPANERVRHIVEGLVERAKEQKKEEIRKIDEVDLSWITNFDFREMKFFQELIQDVLGFTLEGRYACASGFWRADWRV